MPGPYDYTINIPQPPAQNFLQSLMGIMQLRQMQEQSALQQQQAAFQQQMQPLQLEAERARIGQIGQATAAAAEALRGSRLQNEQLQRQSDFQKELVDFTSKPVEQWSESEVRSLAAKGSAIDPARTKGVLEFWANQPKPEKNLVDDTAMKAGIAIAQNRPDVAKSIVDQAKSDAEKLGFTTASKFLNFGGFQLDKDPAYAYATILGHFATDKAKLDQLVTASELKGKMAQTAALTQEALAKAYSTKETKQVDEEKRALDLEKERLQIQEIQQKIDAGRSDKVKIYASQNKEGYKLNEEARNATLQAEKARGILDKIDSGEVKLPKGAGASIGQWISDKVPFLANDITFLRTQYQGLLAPEAKKMLPPGSASDADMKAAREGLLNKNATPQQFRKAVDVIAKISEDQAKYAEAKLGWISENEGSIGTAVKDISVFGVPVKKGTPLNAWWNNVGKNLDLNKLPTESASAPAKTTQPTGAPDLTTPPAGAVRRIK